MVALISFLGAFALAWGGTRLLIARVPRRQFLDVPNERSSHETPTPRFGGIAIFISLAAVVGALSVWNDGVRHLCPALAGAVLLFVAGLVDDWRGLPVPTRFGVQLAAAGVPVACGLSLDHVTLPVLGTVSLGWVGVVVTILLVMASANFYNFIDGIDGLAAGAAFIGALFLALIGMMLGHTPIALLYLVVAGSTVGFLQYNFPPAALFMGDGGSTVLGYVFAVLALAGNAASPEIPIFIPLLILSSLYLDAGLTLLARLVRGEKIFQAHHTHYYQRLLSLGLNHKQVTLLEYALTALLGTGALVYFKAGNFFAPFLALCWLAVFTSVILKIRSLERGDRVFWKARALFVVATDVVLIAAAFVGAYFVRMNFQFTHAEGRAMLKALPLVVVVRTAVFYRYGLYRSLWKYMSVADVIRVIKAVTTGSVIILTAVVLLYRFVAFPRSLFLIEYVLLTLFILGSRFSFRLFYEIGRESNGTRAVRYAVVGAGDYGERLARGIKSRDGGSAEIACFVDDAPEKIGLVLHDAPIDGPVSRLDEICRARRVDMVVVGVRTPGADLSGRVVVACERAAVPIASAHDSIRPGDEPWEVTQSRIARRSGRTLPVPPEDGSLCGRSVLVLRGGGVTARLLPDLLVRAGAEVCIHVESVDEARRYASETNCRLGSLGTDDSARELFDAVRPDTVVLPAELAPPFSDAVWRWRYLVEETWRVVGIAGRSGVGVVLVSQWGTADAYHADASLVALAEAALFVEGSGAPARAVRLPSVLTPADLMPAVLRADSERATTAWDLTELEAARVVAGCVLKPQRGIYVPVWRGSLTVSDIRTPRSRADAAAQTGRPAAEERSAPRFPAEQLHAVRSGVARVSGPLDPMGHDIRPLVQEALITGDARERDRLTGMLVGKLRRVSADRLGAGADG